MIGDTVIARNHLYPFWKGVPFNGSVENVPTPYSEILCIDFHLHSFGHVRRIVRSGSFMNFIVPNLSLRLRPVLNCVAVVTTFLLI